jgi:hypothetical protein
MTGSSASDPQSAHGRRNRTGEQNGARSPRDDHETGKLQERGGGYCLRRSLNSRGKVSIRSGSEKAATVQESASLVFLI